MTTELTPKQEKFCQEYIKDLNGTQAAIRAGYSQNSANEQASQLLAKLNIQNRVKELNEQIKNKNIADAKEIREFFTKQLRGLYQEECVVVEGIGDGCSRAATIKKEITPKDRQKAAELLGKMDRLFDDTPQSPVTIIINAEYE